MDWIIDSISKKMSRNLYVLDLNSEKMEKLWFYFENLFENIRQKKIILDFLKKKKIVLRSLK